MGLSPFFRKPVSPQRSRAEVVPDGLGIPSRPVQKSLNALRPGFAYPFDYLPAVLAAHTREQPAEGSWRTLSIKSYGEAPNRSKLTSFGIRIFKCAIVLTSSCDKKLHANEAVGGSATCDTNPSTGPNSAILSDAVQWKGGEVIEESTRAASDEHTRAGVIDCDVHNNVPSMKALHPYLTDRWRDYVIESGVGSLEANYYPPGAPLSARPGSKATSGGPPGSDLDLLREQLLDPWDVQHAILNCIYGVQMVHNEDWALAMARATNDWQIAEWLEKDSRLRASIVVPTQNPEMAAQEIDRLGRLPGFVQVLLLAQSETPLGKRHHWPIYEAAERHGLAIGVHAGGATGNPIMPVGWPSYYLEDYISLAQAFQSQLVSLVAEGVFAKFPDLRVVLIEGGFTWLPSLMWRLDKNWKGLRREVPWVDRLPSEIVHEHVRLTIQPVDEPPDPEDLLRIIEQLGSEELLLFSTDYPHWHFDEREDALPVKLPADLERKILSENARAVYRL